MRFMIGLFFAPWQTFAVLTGLIVALGVTLVTLDRSTEANKAAALAAGPPALTALKDHRAGDEGRYRDEVHLAVWVDPAFTSHLTVNHKDTYTSRADERVMFFLFDPSENAGTGRLRGAALVRKSDVGLFDTYVAAHLLDPTGAKPGFALSGTSDHDNDFDDLVGRAVAASGLMPSADFVVVEPWLRGREAVFAAQPETEMLFVKVFSGLAAATALIGLIKYRRRPATRPVGLARPFMASSVALRQPVGPQAVAAPTPWVQAEPVPPPRKAGSWIGTALGFGARAVLVSTFGLPALVVLWPMALAKLWGKSGLRTIPAPTVYLLLFILSIVLIRYEHWSGWPLFGVVLLNAIVSALWSALKGLFGLFLPASRPAAPIARPAPAPAVRPQQPKQPRAVPLAAPPVPAAMQPGFASPIESVPTLFERLTGRGRRAGGARGASDPYDRLFDRTQRQQRSSL